MDFLLQHGDQRFGGDFNKHVVATNNPKLFHMFYEKQTADRKDKWIQQGMMVAIQMNKQAIIDCCFEHVYSPQWWDSVRYTYGGLKSGPMELGLDYLESKVHVVQQRNVLEQAVGPCGHQHTRKL